jgi:hypothetical protein
LKFMDYSIAMRRHLVNRELVRSERDLAAGHGAHHRYDDYRFVREAFLDPANMVNRRMVKEFEFSSQIEQIQAKLVESNGFYLVPHTILALAEIPDRLRSVF